MNGVPNRAIADRYELLDELGRGGMGIVFRARDLRLKRLVALKLAGQAVVADPELRARFLREADALARVRDLGVIAIHDVGEDEETPWLVMDLCEGGSLQDALRSGPLTAAPARDLLGQAASGLRAIHAAGILHRDLKPANILRSGDRWVIGDFGIAAASGATKITRTGVVMGTPEFWAPEVMREDAPIGAASDVYSLGCVLYAAWVGEPPYRGENPLAVGMRHVTDPMPPIPDVLRRQDPELASLIAQMLAKDPAARPRVEELVEVAASGGALQTAPTVLDTVTKASSAETEVVAQSSQPSGHRKRIALIALGLLVIGSIVAVGLFVGRGGERDSAPEAAGVTQAAPRPARAISVPRLVGLSQAEASAALRDEAAETGAVPPRLLGGGSRYSDQESRGRILSQTPSPGGRVKAGGRVEVVLSKGSAVTTVPAISEGLSIDVARARLRARGLGARVRGEQDASVPHGAVIGSEPSSGESIARPASVTLVVSTGAPPPSTPETEPVDLLGPRDECSNAVSDTPILITVQTGEVSCDGAAVLFQDYLFRAPNEGQGSGAVVSFDGWTCSKGDSAAATDPPIGSCSRDDGSAEFTVFFE